MTFVNTFTFFGEYIEKNTKDIVENYKLDPKQFKELILMKVTQDLQIYTEFFCFKEIYKVEKESEEISDELLRKFLNKQIEFHKKALNQSFSIQII